jgi:hypothetical protein
MNSLLDEAMEEVRTKRPWMRLIIAGQLMEQGHQVLAIAIIEQILHEHYAAQFTGDVTVH